MAESIDIRIPYYTRGARAFNFGDYLTEFFLQRMLGEPFVEASQYRLVGSAISDALIDQDLRGLPDSARIAYWCCGARDAAGISLDRKKRCDFWGVRGPLSREALELPDDMPLGDPGFLVPLLHSPRKVEALTGKTASMVHFSALDRSETLNQKVGADVVLSPSVSSFEELEQLFDKIASVDFLFTASLHGAIIASAFGTPFAFWDYGEIDVPFKWEDTSALLGIECSFHERLSQGLKWWDSHGRSLRLPALTPMLAACPFSVRPTIWRRAMAHDFAANVTVSEGVGFDRSDWISLARQRNRNRSDISIVATATHIARSELSAAHRILAHASGEVERRLRALTVNFRQTPTVDFADGSLGHALLSTGWTPANDIAPWSLPPFGEIILPSGSGWEEADVISLSGYLYAPMRADGSPNRTVCIWLNEVLAFEQRFLNIDGSPSMVVDMTIPISSHLKLPRDLVVRIYVDHAPTPSEAGMFEDDRRIGFAPLRLALNLMRDSQV